MEQYHFLNEFHLLAEWQLEVFEDTFYHFRAYIVVVVECPAACLFPAFRLRLADIVEQSSPPKPEVVGYFCQVVEHLQRMQEVVFVCPSVDRLHPFHSREFGHYKRQQPCGVEQAEADRRFRREHYLVQFVGNTLFGDDGDTLPVSPDSHECFVFDIESELS